MKEFEKKQARVLRKQGFSLAKIAERLNVSKSSASLWTRDIELSQDQLKVLYANNRNAQLGNKKKSAIYKSKRLDYQKHGAQRAKEGNILHAQGCMLFWAEGGKSKNSLIFCNSDAAMLCLFHKFLKLLDVEDERIAVSVSCYLDNGLSLIDIENYWLKILGLPRSALKKSTVNRVSKYSKKLKGNKHKYGICRLVVHDTRLVQEVYGAIKQYANISDDRWLF